LRRAHQTSPPTASKASAIGNARFIEVAVGREALMGVYSPSLKPLQRRHSGFDRGLLDEELLAKLSQDSGPSEPVVKQEPEGQLGSQRARLFLRAATKPLSGQEERADGIT
jgi:hypothetical protein